MAFEHRPLTEPELGPAVWKVAQPEAPAALQGMVARGLAPLSPRDQVVALYQLWVSNKPELSEQAAKTTEGLPWSMLGGALGDAGLHPGVLDFLGRKLPRNVAVLEAIVRHPRVDDETLVGLSRICPETICDLVAHNQVRWLRCPAIVKSLYQNPHCRMSEAQRMLELAVREGLELRLPNMDEIKLALASKAGERGEEQEDFGEAADDQFRTLAQHVIQGQEQAMQVLVDAAADEAFDLAMPDDPDLSDEELAELDAELERVQQAEATATAAAAAAPTEDEVTRGRGDRVSQIAKLSPMKKIRLALIGSAFERRILIRDSNKSVCLSAIKSPRIKENEVVAYCANRSLAHDVVRYIANRREWTKLYAVKLNLVLNPKTPMASAMTFLTHLHAHDVRKVGHSKNIPTALAMAAKRRAQQRR